MDIDKIYNGNCIDLLKDVKDKEVDISFTSPPFNRKRNDKYSFYTDQIDDYYGFLLKVTDEMLRVTKKYVIVNLQKNYYNKAEVFRYLGHYADRILDIVIWEKSNPLPANQLDITNSYEMFVILGDIPLRANSTYVKNHITTTVNNDMPDCHKAVMKPEVCEFFIQNFTKENDVVLDIFMGLGTTAVICKENGRHYIGFEIVKEYCELAQKRINSFNSRKTSHLSADTTDTSTSYGQLNLFELGLI